MPIETFDEHDENYPSAKFQLIQPKAISDTVPYATLDGIIKVSFPFEYHFWEGFK